MERLIWSTGKKMLKPPLTEFNDFSKADVIVSVGADFLGDWQGGGYDASYAKGSRITSYNVCYTKLLRS